MVTSLSRCGRSCRDLLPGVALGTGLDRRENALDLEAVGERGGGVGARGDVADQVDGLVGEAVLVADEMTRRPPGPDVRMVGLRHQDAPEAGGGAGLGAVEE